jgi:transposase-like protein
MPTKAREHFLNEQAALKCLYLVVCSLDPPGKGRQRWTNRWKKALNAFEITSMAVYRQPGNNPQTSYTVNLTDPTT